MPPAPATADMLAEMSACAYRLGMAFGREAERAEDFARQMELFRLFDRCFFAVRVATALQLRLGREGALAREPDREAEVLEEAETAEEDRPERERFEADRDRERETASLPIFLKTLEGVAADASALPGPAPAELPTLKDLLARIAPARPAPLRDRLAGSAALALASPRPSPILAARRATGPPRPT